MYADYCPLLLKEMDCSRFCIVYSWLSVEDVVVLLIFLPGNMSGMIPRWKEEAADSELNLIVFHHVDISRSYAHHNVSAAGEV